MPRPGRIAISAAIAFAFIVVVTNGAYWVAEAFDDDPAGPGSCAVLVLGSPTRADGSPGSIQRFRVAAGVGAYNTNQCGAIVLSGGAAHNRFVEARSMAQLAVSHGVPRDHIIIEDKARSTWQNVGCAAPLVARYDRILIVSDSLHAFRARRYACRQSAELCRRVRAEGRVGPVGLWWWRVAGAFYELSDYIRDKLVYERHPERNAPVCPVGPRHSG